ncbi:GNAT family N-acetyltransferase [Halomonas salinarum]|uniref:GNAT family N-acetyltransferase n=1 Tax=Halomonas salinarum TaxID=1158993 RepID=UPI00143AE753|nr:GNAT family N-acetyltransferase [Halomonas salinarum]
MPVRPATHDDLPALGELVDGYRRFYGQTSDLAAARDFAASRLALGDSHLLVDEGPDGALRGLVQLNPTLSTVRLAVRWILGDLYVAPEARRQGVGRALMNAARTLAESRGVSQLRLQTQVENHAAKALYASLGWRCDDDFDHYALSLPAATTH